jgi:hypothetical protein
MQVIYVSAEQIRAEFNGRDWCAICESPEFTCQCTRENTPEKLNKQPIGTKSQIWTITRISDGTKIALVHRYLRSDGTSSKPDPKYLLVGEVIWKVKLEKI